jgi:hypothetical protein
MVWLRTILVFIGVLCVLSGPTWGQGGPSAALMELQGRYPGVRAYEVGPRIRLVYGRPMTSGVSGREAAENWLAEPARDDRGFCRLLGREHHDKAHRPRRAVRAGCCRAPLGGPDRAGSDLDRPVRDAGVGHLRRRGS